MNNAITKCCIFILILSSCTKVNFNNEITADVLLLEVETETANQEDINSERLVSLNPPSVNLNCSESSAVLIPRIITGESIELIFAKVAEYEGEPATPKAIKWKVNGQTILQLTDHLKLPYQLGYYYFEVLVTLKNGNELSFGFDIDVTADLMVDEQGYIDYQYYSWFACNRCIIFGPCCAHPYNNILVLCPFIS